MTQSSKRDLTKKTILEILKDPLNEAGLETEELRKRVSEQLKNLGRKPGSRSTLWKYIDEMERKDHTITRSPNPKDSRSKMIKANPETAGGAFALLEALGEIEKVTRGIGQRSEWKELTGLDLDRQEATKTELRAYMIQMRRIHDLFAIAYKLICEQNGRPNEPWTPGEVYLRVETRSKQAPNSLWVMSEQRRHLMHKECVMLAMIIQAAERDANFMRALQKAVPGLVDEYSAVEEKLGLAL